MPDMSSSSRLVKPGRQASGSEGRAWRGLGQKAATLRLRPEELGVYFAVLDGHGGTQAGGGLGDSEVCQLSEGLRSHIVLDIDNT